jgi:hypothetical protein
MQLTQAITTLHANNMNFNGMPLIIAVKTMNGMCAGPEMTTAMAIPAVGQAVAGLCSKIASVELKVDLLQSRAEFTLNGGLEAQESLRTRLSSTPEGQMVLAQIVQNSVQARGMG